MTTRRFPAIGGRFALDVRQDPHSHKITLHLFDGSEEILHLPCVHVVVSGESSKLSEVRSVDDLIHLEEESHISREPALRQSDDLGYQISFGPIAQMSSIG